VEEGSFLENEKERVHPVFQTMYVGEGGEPIIKSDRGSPGGEGTGGSFSHGPKTLKKTSLSQKEALHEAGGMKLGTERQNEGYYPSLGGKISKQKKESLSARTAI